MRSSRQTTSLLRKLLNSFGCKFIKKFSGSYIAIQTHWEDSVGVAVVAYFGAFFKVVNAELSRVGHAHNGDQTARKQSLNNANVFHIFFYIIRFGINSIFGSIIVDEFLPHE